MILFLGHFIKARLVGSDDDLLVTMRAMPVAVAMVVVVVRIVAVRVRHRRMK